MTYVTLQDYTPGARYGPTGQPATTPWNRVRIEEAADLEGPWTALETQALDPLDEDPSEPQARNVSTNLATLDEGWYRLVFLDAADVEQPTDPVFTGAEPNFEPALSDVGSLVRARTKNRVGEELGTFTDDTRPTDNEVRRLIRESLSAVAARVGPTMTEANRPAARSLVALRTAMLIELSYFPEQVREGTSPYDQYKALYDASLADLLATVADEPGPTGGPRFGSFPVTTITARDLTPDDPAVIL